MDIILEPVLRLIHSILSMFNWLIILNFLLSWLIHFNIVNSYSPGIQVISQFLFKITEPVLGFIRRLLPDTGMIDLSSIVALLVIGFMQNMIEKIIMRLALPI